MSKSENVRHLHPSAGLKALKIRRRLLQMAWMAMGRSVDLDFGIAVAKKNLTSVQFSTFVLANAHVQSRHELLIGLSL